MKKEEIASQIISSLGKKVRVIDKDGDKIEGKNINFSLIDDNEDIGIYESTIDLCMDNGEMVCLLESEIETM